MIRTSAKGAYQIFEFFTWALNRRGRLISAGRLLSIEEIT